MPPKRRYKKKTFRKKRYNKKRYNKIIPKGINGFPNKMFCKLIYTVNVNYTSGTF